MTFLGSLCSGCRPPEECTIMYMLSDPTVPLVVLLYHREIPLVFGTKYSTM